MNYDRFINRVKSLGSMPSTGATVAAVRATLATLGERLHGNESQHLAAQLPREIAAYVGSPSSGRFTLSEFYGRVAHRAGIRRIEEAAHAARAVMRVVTEAVAPGEMEDVLAQLPSEFDALFAFEESGERTVFGQNGDDGFSDMRVAELMTSEVRTVTPATTIAEAARRMRDFDCGALPVVDEGRRPVGMITDRDITLNVAARALDASQIRVGDCMSEGLTSCRSEDTIDECLDRMSRNQVRRVPVVNSGGRLVGIISQADLARHADSHRGHGERRSLATAISEISEPAATASP